MKFRYLGQVPVGCGTWDGQHRVATKFWIDLCSITQCRPSQHLQVVGTLAKVSKIHVLVY